MEQRQSIAKHFKTLSQNHDELVKIKDDYKVANDELRRRKAQLLDENNNMTFPLVQQKEEELTKLKGSSENLKSENACLQKSIRLSTVHIDVYTPAPPPPPPTRTHTRARTHTHTYTCTTNKQKELTYCLLSL